MDRVILVNGSHVQCQALYECNIQWARIATGKVFFRRFTRAATQAKLVMGRWWLAEMLGCGSCRSEPRSWPLWFVTPLLRCAPPRHSLTKTRLALIEITVLAHRSSHDTACLPRIVCYANTTNVMPHKTCLAPTICTSHDLKLVSCDVCDT